MTRHYSFVLNTEQCRHTCKACLLSCSYACSRSRRAMADKPQPDPHKLKVVELKEELSQRGLDISGLKKDVGVDSR